MVRSKNKKRHYVGKWWRVCRSKKKGGLGVKDLRKWNISLLCKWWWNLEFKQFFGKILSKSNI
jgi:hypothetical protein